MEIETTLLRFHMMSFLYLYLSYFVVNFLIFRITIVIYQEKSVVSIIHFISNYSVDYNFTGYSNYLDTES